MKNNSTIFYIYGIYDNSGACVYIGQTKRPISRERAHVIATDARFRGMDFCVLRTATADNVARLELQIGVAYKRKGQAKYSERFGNVVYNTSRGLEIYIDGFDPFYGITEAAEAMGISANQIRKYSNKWLSHPWIWIETKYGPKQPLMWPPDDYQI